MKQGEVWLVNLDPTVGAEIQKTRPAIIINDDHLGKLPLKIIAPLTDWKEKYTIAPWMVKVQPNRSNNLSKDSSIYCFQIRSVAEERLVKRLGFVNIETMLEVRKALAIVLSMA
jgi:mRNA interferase MazF